MICREKVTIYTIAGYTVGVVHCIVPAKKIGSRESEKNPNPRFSDFPIKFSEVIFYRGGKKINHLPTIKSDLINRTDSRPPGSRRKKLKTRPC